MTLTSASVSIATQWDTRHLRHGEIAKAVIDLWNEGSLSTNNLWNFAYEDGDPEYFLKVLRQKLSINYNASNSNI